MEVPKLVLSSERRIRNLRVTKNNRILLKGQLNNRLTRDVIINFGPS